MVEEWRQRLAAREFPRNSWGEAWKPAAVFLLLLPRQGSYDILLTRRTHSVRHHRGQISFPGGAIDPEDADALSAAYREVQEEVGIPKTAITLLGELEELTAVTGFRVKPFVGVVAPETPLTPNEHEISEMLLVPLVHVMNPENWWTQEWQGGHIFHLDWQGHDVWGLTGRILHVFVSVITGTVPLPIAES